MSGLKHMMVAAAALLAVTTLVARPAAKPARPAARPAVSAVRAKAPAAKRSVAPQAKRKGPPPQTGKSAPPGAGPLAPYRGAIAIDADTGEVIYADHPNRTAFPASVTKLMTFLLVLEDLQAGRYARTDRVAGSAYAASMEPSKVDLLPGQTMSVDDLLFALMVKSANDGAVALAAHAAWAAKGGKGPVPADANTRELVQAFVARMNRRAGELGMAASRYESPNGLPPGLKEARGFDTSTAADLAKLCRRIVEIDGALKYTSAATRTVTQGSGQPLALATHNYFLPGSHDKDGLATPVPGCDGLKTGYTAASGSSIALTAARDGRRVIVVVVGCAGRHEREAAAGRILRDALGAVAVW
ncbi:MAG: D-alanyl-D-alanine carboxypeptidase family protein [Kiritimatiellia bacterium]